MPHPSPTVTGRIIPVLILLSAALSALPAAADNRLLTELLGEVEVGYRAGDLAQIELARDTLLGISASHTRADQPPPDQTQSDDTHAVKARYYAAYARFRQALAAADDRSAARDYLEDCISELKSLVGLQPAHAEARALLGSCYGMSTRHDVLSTMTRGLEARRQMAEARRLAPDNPWVVMQDGLADWATPRVFGGDRELAMTKLVRAAGLFAEVPGTDSPAAGWGAAEAWYQLGERYLLLGQAAEAEDAFRRAASLVPAASPGSRRLAEAF